MRGRDRREEHHPQYTNHSPNNHYASWLMCVGRSKRSRWCTSPLLMLVVLVLIETSLFLATAQAGVPGVVGGGRRTLMQQHGGETYNEGQSLSGYAHTSGSPQSHDKDQSGMEHHRGRDYISPKEYLVALYVIPLWLCLILICLRGSTRWSNRNRDPTARRRRNRDPNTNEDGQANTSSTSEGLSTSTLDKISQFEYNLNDSKKGKDMRYHNKVCSICMDNFAQGDMIRLLPGCGHTFHSECVDEWLSLHATCPICRMDTRQALRELEGGDGEEASPRVTTDESNGTASSSAQGEQANGVSSLDVERTVDPESRSGSRATNTDGGVAGHALRFGFFTVGTTAEGVRGPETETAAESSPPTATSATAPTYTLMSNVSGWITNPLQRLSSNWHSRRYQSRRSESHRNRARQAAREALPSQ